MSDWEFTGAYHQERTHRHFHYGDPCRCPWGYDEGGEHYGSVHEAAKLDWLRNRPDMQDDEGQALLDKLEDKGYDEADKMLPWIIREYRKKRLSFEHPSRPDAHLSYLTPNGMCVHCMVDGQHASWCRHSGEVQDSQKQRTWFTPQHAKEWQETLQSMKNYRQGVDLMQHPVHELDPKIKAHQEFLEQKARAKAGRVVHTFDDGWTVRQLRDAQECKWEGKEMHHCVGDPTYGHPQKVVKGDTIIMSLRTPENKPQGTMEIGPGYWFDPKEPMGEENRYGFHQRMDMEDQEKKARLIPHPDGGDVRQWYGPWDDTPEPEHSDRMNEWLERYNMSVEGGEEPFEPWWPAAYDTHAPSTVDEYVDYANGDFENLIPEEYHQAHSDAEDHDVEGPELNHTAPEWDEIWRDHTTFNDENDPHTRWRPGQFDPSHEAEPMRDAARISEELSNHYNEWKDWKEEMEHQGGGGYSQNEQALHDWWKNEFAQHHNPDTGQWEDPRPAYRGWQTAVDRWWQQNQVNYPQLPGVAWQNHDDDQTQPIPNHIQQGIQQSIFSKFASENPPIYYRWALSPETGDVELGHNQEDHPAFVPSHEELSGRINRPNLSHGYAYRLHGGWRLTDWEHRPIEDRFTTSQILRALGSKDLPQEDAWGPADLDFERTHHGLPLPAED